MTQNCSRLVLSKSKAIITYRWYSSTTVSKNREESLLGKLSALSITDTQLNEKLDELTKQGKPVKRYDVINCVNHLRKYKRYQHALQLYEWMDKSKNKLNNADRAIRIDLLAKTKGIESAESYFYNLQKSAKTEKTYGALLNCYCRENMLEKALELFDKMGELGFTSHALNYNNLMSLYIRVGQPHKVALLVQEMEEKNVAPDLYSYNQLINSYASLKDFETVEKVVEKMIVNKVKHDWFTYGNLATVYVNAGFIDKANAALEKLEKFENLHDPKAFDTLITLYARTSNPEGVNRAWNSLKTNHPKPSNISYLVMLLALSKLGDIEGLEKCFSEWESGCLSYDVRVSNVILESYLDRDMLEEANLLIENVVKKGAEPNLRTLNLFTEFYLKKGQINLAMQYLEKGASKLSSEKGSWFPHEESVSVFLKYFEVEKDVDGAEKFCDIMKAINRLDPKVYDSLLLTYIAAGKVKPQMRQKMKDAGIVISSTTEKLLEKVCPE